MRNLEVSCARRGTVLKGKKKVNNEQKKKKWARGPPGRTSDALLDANRAPTTALLANTLALAVKMGFGRRERLIAGPTTVDDEDMD